MTEAGWTSRQIVYHELERMASIYPLTVGDNKSSEGMTRLLESLIAKMDDAYQKGRVAGIKQGIEKLREREKFYTEQEAISEGQMRLARGLQRNESSCCIHELEQLAQAAQDEKGVGDVLK